MSSWRRCRRSSPWPVGCWIFSLDYGVWKKRLFLVVLNSYSFMIMKGEGRFWFFCSKFFETSLVGPSPLFVGLRSQSHSETRTRRSRSAAWSRQRPQGVLKVICAIFTCMIRLKTGCSGSSADVLGTGNTGTEEACNMQTGPSLKKLFVAAVVGAAAVSLWLP